MDLLRELIEHLPTDLRVEEESRPVRVVWLECQGS
jgi:hypothetical protein